MEVLYSLAIGILAGSGVWLLLRPRTFQLLLGISLLSYATNLFIFGMGRLATYKPPIITTDNATDAALYADPVPQALVLTAIVIAFAMTAVAVVVAMRNHADLRSDHVDADEPLEDQR